jgi:CTP synthase
MKGGTMRLGAYPCAIKEGTLAHRIYGTSLVSERHRHRYEFNNQYLEQYEKGGMVASGCNPETGLVEIMEIPEHPFFIGSQYHPELKSTVENPHPLFVNFVAAARQFNERRTSAKNTLLQSELI